MSFSAILTLAHGGARTLALTTALPRHQSLAAFRLGALARYRVPVWTRTLVSAIRGRPRVEEVELTRLVGGGPRTVACDAVVFLDAFFLYWLGLRIAIGASRMVVEGAGHGIRSPDGP